MNQAVAELAIAKTLSKFSQSIILQDNYLMLLIYRGHVFNASIRSPQPYRKPIALNWRYCVSGDSYGDEVRAIPAYKSPRAINWRWCAQS